MGFEYFYGFLAGEASQYEPNLVRNTTLVPPPRTPEEGYHLSEDLADDAIGWLGQEDGLERGDLEDGMNAAAQIGDDKLQRESTGRVRPEGCTHGSSQQRVSWFKRGVDGGSVQQCNTFN